MWLSVCVPGEDARPRGLQHHWWLCPCGCGQHAPSDCLKMLAIVNPGSHYSCHFWIWMFKDDFKAALSCPTFSFPISFFSFFMLVSDLWLFLFLWMYPCTFIVISVCHSMNLSLTWITVLFKSLGLVGFQSCFLLFDQNTVKLRNTIYSEKSLFYKRKMFL